jgi:hypothetical protein
MPEHRPRPSVNPNNRAYQHFHTIAAQHFDLLAWRVADDLPTLLSLVHPTSGDTLTVALVDSHEIHEPYVLLAISTAVAITAHGPFNGHAAASSQAPYLAMFDDRVAAIRPIRLHRPDHTTPADLGWAAIPQPLLPGLRPALVDTRGCVLLLVDRAAGRLAAAGPFPHRAAARGWALSAGLPAGIDPILAPLIPAPPLPPPATGPEPEQPTTVRDRPEGTDDE